MSFKYQVDSPEKVLQDKINNAEQRVRNNRDQINDLEKENAIWDAAIDTYKAAIEKIKN